MGVKVYKHGSYKWMLNKITLKFLAKIWKMLIDTEKSIWREIEAVEFYLGHVKFEVTQDIQVFTWGYELRFLNCENLDLTQG